MPYISSGSSSCSSGEEAKPARALEVGAVRPQAAHSKLAFGLSPYPCLVALCPEHVYTRPSQAALYPTRLTPSLEIMSTSWCTPHPHERSQSELEDGHSLPNSPSVGHSTHDAPQH
jgi:hypothetical protein